MQRRKSRSGVERRKSKREQGEEWEVDRGRETKESGEEIERRPGVGPKMEGENICSVTHLITAGWWGHGLPETGPP